MRSGKNRVETNSLRINFIIMSLLAMMLTLTRAWPVNAADVDCLDTPTALDYWRPVRDHAATSDAAADKLALELMPCLGSPDPVLRDQIAYELFTYWLRGNKLTDKTRRTLLVELGTTMNTRPEVKPGNSALARSFSSLILSEIMRSDSIVPFMSDDERQILLDQAIVSIERENDYRGLDATLGWVHPVAHMSDLLWRFALHPDTSAAQAEAILDAVRTKIAPTAVAYSFNESDRLARVVTTIVRRKMVTPEKLGAWLRSFEAPSSMEKWSDAFLSREAMAELHNTKLFLRALADQLDATDIDPLIAGPLRDLVQEFTQLI